MIHVVLPFALASILAGAGVHAILARRNAVLVLIGVELVLAAANLVLVTSSAVLPDRDSAGQVLAVFIITLAAAEVTLALGIILFAFRQRGHIDLTRGLFEDDDAGETDDQLDDGMDAPGTDDSATNDATPADSSTDDVATTTSTITGATRVTDSADDAPAVTTDEPLAGDTTDDLSGGPR